MAVMGGVIAIETVETVEIVDSIPDPATLEAARHQANAYRKADFLYERGYRALWLTEDVLEVMNPRGRSYRVDTFNRECDCDGYILHSFCSHLFGWGKLVRDQEIEERETHASNAANA